MTLRQALKLTKCSKHYKSHIIEYYLHRLDEVESYSLYFQEHYNGLKHNNINYRKAFIKSIKYFNRLN